MLMPFASTTISFSLSYYNADDFAGSVGAGSAKIALTIAAEAASSCSHHSMAANHGYVHNSRMSTGTTDGKLIAALGASYVHST